MNTILIIEDNKDIREKTAEILELSEFNVLQAENGKIGLDLATQLHPDIILCDIMMPELDGYGVLYLLSKNPDTASIPFIFLTAKADKMDFRKGMEMGADDYLDKPFNASDLLHAIETRLHKKEALQMYYSKSLNDLEKLAAGNTTGQAELKNLIDGKKVRQLKKKQCLYYEGDQPQGLYLLLSGSIKTVKRSSDNRELMTGLYLPEDYIGVDALLLSENYTDTAEVLEDSTVYLLPGDMIVNLINRYPQISQQFINILANNVREKERQLLDLAYHSVRKRVAHALLRLSKQLSDNNQFKISRIELASMTGIASETVSRTLTDFKAEGLIERVGSHIYILDNARLQNMKN